MHCLNAAIAVGLAAALAGCGAQTSEGTPEPGTEALAYPATKRDATTESLFGDQVADPYRWLEADPRSDQGVAEWVEAEAKLTNGYLAKLPARAAFRRSLAALYGYDKLSAPVRRGGRYFYTRKSPGHKQAVLYMRDGAGDERPIIDPNGFNPDGSVALAEWTVSADGRRLAYATQEGGSDWRTIRVLDIESGDTLPDQVKWARFTKIAWTKDGAGFFYSRFPQPKPGEQQGSVANQAIYYHAVGTPQAQDRVFHSTPEHPKWLHSIQVTEDGRYAVIYTTDDLVHSAVTITDLTSAGRRPVKLVSDFRNAWSVVASRGSRLFLITDRGAERFKVATVDMAHTRPTLTDFIPEQPSVLLDGKWIGDRLLLSYSVDARTELRRYKLDGKRDGTVHLPGIGTVSQLEGAAGNSEGFFNFASFNSPNTIYRYDVSTGKSAVWRGSGIAADLGRIVVRQVFYVSKDGTRIPMFIMRRKDVAGPAPTLLYGYGGFSISLTATYTALLTAWADQGGVVAIPNLRGGGEYGAAWHAAGSRGAKQNTFDDFIAAAEYLRDKRIASKDGIAIHGDSNGGLLVGAVTNQRPDLFAAALPKVGVMDMLRFTRFTGGGFLAGEYGDPSRQPDFTVLRRYSPYHNIRTGTSYPAILALTADADDRIVPAHTFKYVAALQAAKLGPKPRLMRVARGAGHDTGVSNDKMIDEGADMFAFAARWTGLAPRDD